MRPIARIRDTITMKALTMAPTIIPLTTAVIRAKFVSRTSAPSSGEQVFTRRPRAKSASAHT